MTDRTVQSLAITELGVRLAALRRLVSDLQDQIIELKQEIATLKATNR